MFHSKWHVESLSFSGSFILFFPIFPSSSASTLDTVSVAVESSSLVPSSWWCGYYYKCFTWSVGLLFSEFSLPLFFSATWSYSMHKIHIAIQELQVVALMLHRMDFCLSGKVVWIIVLLKLIYVIKVVEYFFLYRYLKSSWQACYYSLIPADIHTHLNVKAEYLMWKVSEWPLLPCIAQASFNFWANQSWTCWHPYVPINVSIIIPWKTLYL